jgi:hypothetical protein
MKVTWGVMALVALLALGTGGVILAEEPASADEQKVKIESMDEAYYPLIKDARLLRSGAKIKAIPDRGKVLMAIGVMGVKKSANPGQAVALAIAGAQAEARAEMVKYLYGVQSQTGTEVHDMLNVTTFTREEAEGFVRAAEQRGQWIAEDGTMLGVLLVFDPNSVGLAEEMRDKMMMTGKGAPVEKGKGVVEKIDEDYDPD